MKLRNKKTGKIFDWSDEIIPYGFGLPHPKSLAELNEEWEDVEPAEPLIKDEKIRKAVKAWAEANNIITFEYRRYEVNFLIGTPKYGVSDLDISFKKPIKGLENGKEYTIAELCGEEEE